MTSSLGLSTLRERFRSSTNLNMVSPSPMRAPEIHYPLPCVAEVMSSDKIASAQRMACEMVDANPEVMGD